MTRRTLQPVPTGSTVSRSRSERRPADVRVGISPRRFAADARASAGAGLALAGESRPVPARHSFSRLPPPCADCSPAGSKLPVQRLVTYKGRELTEDQVQEWYGGRQDTLFTVLPDHILLEQMVAHPLYRLELRHFKTGKGFREALLSFEELVEPEKEKEKEVKLDLQYGSGHGDYHFTGKVTKKKAQWSIDKSSAQALMEKEVKKHLKTLIAGSSPEGWTPWYVGGNAGKEIGVTVAGGESMFCIQLQVSLEHGLISYHGYPDQRLLKTGVGKTKKGIK